MSLLPVAFRKRRHDFSQVFHVCLRIYPGRFNAGMSKDVCGLFVRDSAVNKECCEGMTQHMRSTPTGPLYAALDYVLCHDGRHSRGVCEPCVRSPCFDEQRLTVRLGPGVSAVVLKGKQSQIRQRYLTFLLGFTRKNSESVSPPVNTTGR